MVAHVEVLVLFVSALGSLVFLAGGFRVARFEASEAAP